MTESFTRSYSRYSQNAVALLGLLIRQARIEHKMTVAQLAERAGVSRGLVQRVEHGEMGSAVGVVFELAALVGVPLFTEDQTLMKVYTSSAEKNLSLLPSAVHHPKKVVKDDF